ncbi:hypothetical protein HYT05_02125 [Candidatus Kaiserbacteria bacterium]|nr:hypothetical protein [Candidatus Kaiserbacteria bacterium]
MSPKKWKVIRQPMDVGDGKCHPESRSGGWTQMLRPGAFYFHAGRLYVGYGWLSTFHEGEEPVWDPDPVPLHAVIETCNGYYHFSSVFAEGPPYFRRYAELSVRYICRPDDFGSGFLKKKIDQGRIDIHEKLVLPPDYYLEYQWDGGFGGGHALLLRKRRDPKELMPKIKKASSLSAMRTSPEARTTYREMLKGCTCDHHMRPG